MGQDAMKMAGFYESQITDFKFRISELEQELERARVCAAAQIRARQEALGFIVEVDK